MLSHDVKPEGAGSGSGIDVLRDVADDAVDRALEEVLGAEGGETTVDDDRNRGSVGLGAKREGALGGDVRVDGAARIGRRVVSPQAGCCSETSWGSPMRWA